MRPFKLFPLLCLSLLILIQPLAAQTSSASQTASASGYGIDPAASYPGTMVIDLLAAAEDEAIIAIDEAYADGYKAGLLAAAPDAAYWKSLADNWKSSAVAELSRPRLPWWCIPASVAGGLGIGVIASMVVR